MEKDQITPPKVSLWIALAPFICLLPLNTASAFLQDISAPVKHSLPYFKRRDEVTMESIAIFLSLIIGYKCFQSRVNLSLKKTILAEILLTSALIICQIIAVVIQQLGPSIIKEGPARYCFWIYTLLWPLFKLRYNLYLHQCSHQKSNKAFLYSSAMCMQILPSLLGKMIGRFFHHENDLETIKIYFSLILAFQICVTFLAFLTSLALYRKTFSWIPNDILTSTSLNTEGQKYYSVGKIVSKIYLYFIIAGAFGVIDCIKSRFMLPIQYSTEPSIYTVTFTYDKGLKDPVFFACFVHIFRVLAIFCAGKLLDKFNKTKIFYLFVAGLLYTMIVRNYFEGFTDGASALGFYFSLLWGFCDLIQLAIQAMISADDNGSPELFFVSGVSFWFKDLIRRIVMVRDNYERMISCYMIIQTIIIILFVFLKKTRKTSEFKIKL